MKTFTSLIFATLVATLTYVGTTPSVFACSPPLPPTPVEMFDRADVVFRGRVVSVATSTTEAGHIFVTGVVQADSYWKGEVKRTVTINSGGIFSCGPSFGHQSKGEEYLIYGKVYKGAPYSYYVEYNGIRPVAAVAAQIAALGTGTSTVPSISIRFEKSLTLGNQGSDVVTLQTWLEERGFLIMPPGVSKGYFGPLTRSAVAAYQKVKGIEPAVGYFGPITRKSIHDE